MLCQRFYGKKGRSINPLYSGFGFAELHKKMFYTTVTKMRKNVYINEGSKNLDLKICTNKLYKIIKPMYEL